MGINGHTILSEDYVSFEVAKLLKKKGFNEPVHYEYHYIISVPQFHKKSHNFNGGEYANCQSEWYSAPTHQMAMKWLREVHNINIVVVPHSFKEDKPFDYEFEYWNGAEYHMPYCEKYPTYHELFGKTWKKYEEACEVAIKYALENLVRV